MASLDDEHLILLDPDDENEIRRNNVVQMFLLNLKSQTGIVQ